MRDLVVHRTGLFGGWGVSLGRPSQGLLAFMITWKKSKVGVTVPFSVTDMLSREDQILSSEDLCDRVAWEPKLVTDTHWPEPTQPLEPKLQGSLQK